MCRHQYPEPFVDRVGYVINALSEGRFQSCCPTDSRGEQAPSSLPASSIASKAFGFVGRAFCLPEAAGQQPQSTPANRLDLAANHKSVLATQSPQRSVLSSLPSPTASAFLG